MLTPRGGRFLLFCCALLALGTVGQVVLDRLLGARSIPLPNARVVAWIALVMLFWFFAEWLAFALRVQFLTRRISVERAVWDGRGPVASLWAGAVFRVRLRVTLRGPAGFPHLSMGERVPFGAEQTGGETRYEGPLNAQQPAEWEYRLRCPGIGRLRFEGLALQAGDLQGFFHHRTFLAFVRECRVLPSLHDPGEHGGTVKRHNLLLPPGVHRHRRPGAGSELLDLRDYRPGDPPKTIAWKVSARRGRLMTKEFESEVPVRCTLFLDTSDAVRLGPPGQNALARLAEMAAAVARASDNNRDLIGLCRFDEHGSTVLRPARGGRHLVRLLNLLVDWAGEPPPVGHVRTNAVLPLAYGLAEELYPGMLDPRVNRFPFWLAWLWPPPAYTVLRPRLADYVFPWLPYTLPFYALGAALLLGAAAVILAGPLLQEDTPAGAVLAVLVAVVIVAATAFLRIPQALFFPRKRRRLRWRKRLAALLAVRYRLGPGGLAMLLEDEKRFGCYVQRLLGDHHVPYPLPLYDRRGRYLYAAPAKVPVLASALLRAVTRSHDNELMVLLADLVELTGELAPLLSAVKVALARHHRVLVICPWPPGLPPPPDRLADRPDHAAGPRDEPGRPGVREALRRTAAERFHRAYRELRRTFARLGVAVVCAESGDPARLILDRLDMLRDLRIKR
jgi:uncharacterized protein (DUF58 family)